MGFFWEVSNLKPLDAPIGFAQLRALNQKTNLPPNYVAHGPLLVMAPELHMPLTALSA